MQYSKTALTKFLTHFKEVFNDWQGFDEPAAGEVHPVNTSCLSEPELSCSMQVCPDACCKALHL